MRSKVVGLVAALLVAVAATTAAASTGSPVPRVAPRPVHPLRWEALGDSYSAGTGSDLGPEACGHGHVDASYASRAEPAFASRSATRLGRFELVACGGATIASIEREQLPRVAGADIVTLTAGGNDIGFTSFVEKCFLAGPGHCPSQDPSWSTLHRDLVDLYVRVGEAMDRAPAEGGRLFVLTYPIPFSVDDLQRTASCWLFDHVYRTNALLANALTERLDDEIVRAARDASAALSARSSSRVEVVEWRTAHGVAPVRTMRVDGASRPVATNPDGICSGHAMTHLYRLTAREPRGDDSFHPTQSGYDIAARRLVAALEAGFPGRGSGQQARPAPEVCAVLASDPPNRPSCHLA